MENILNKLKTNKKLIYHLTNIAYMLVTIGITFLIYYLLFSLNGFYPFKKDGSTILMIDAQGQYISYLRYYRELLLNHGNMSYTISKVLGGDFISIFSYYLASPFNLFLVFVSQEDIPAFILITSIIKMMLASLFEYLYLFNRIKKPSFKILFTSIAYSLLSYSFVYLSNFMWLDGVMILPLVALGIDKIDENKMKIIYPLALDYSLITSWYIGAMICIFSVLYFLCVYFKNNKELRNKKKLVRFILYSLCGGLISAFMWVGAFSQFNGTKVQSNFPSFQFYNLGTLLQAFMPDNYKLSYITQNEGYIIGFTSLPVLIFSIQYFFNKGYSLKERIINLILLGFYLIMSMNSYTNTLLHFGSVPTWFPTRYSFIFSFILCSLSFDHFYKLEKQKLLGFGLSIVVIALYVILLIFVPNNNGYTYSFSKETIIVGSITLLLSFVTVIISYIPKLKTNEYVYNIVKLSIIPLCIYSSYLGDQQIIKENQSHNYYQLQETYLNDCSYQQSIDLLKEYDNNNNYRMEMTFNREGNFNGANNNPMFYSYPGLSHYSSSEKLAVKKFFKKIGYRYDGYCEAFDYGSTASMSSFLGLKYLIDDSTDYEAYQPNYFFNSSFEKLDLTSNKEEIDYYLNKTCLPLGFLVNKSESENVLESYKLDNGKTYLLDHFEYQNQIYKTSIGEEYEDIFKPIDYSSSLYYGMSLDSEDEDTHEYYYSGKEGSYIIFKFDNPNIDADAYNLYFCVKNLNSYFVTYIDGVRLELGGGQHNGIHGVDNHIKSHTIKMVAKRDFNNEMIRPEIYYEDLNLLTKYTNSLKSGGINNLKDISSTSTYGYEGNFELNSNSKELLFTLPYDSNFKIYIDGKKVNTYVRYNIFIGASLENISNGEHQIKIIYEEKGVKVGFGLTLSGLLLLTYLLIKSKEITYPYSLTTN
jgi:uncharacterized membrane protein YfhO